EYDWWSFEGQAGDRVDVWAQQLIGRRPSIELFRLNDAGDGVQSLRSDGRNDNGDGPDNDAYISGYELPTTTTYFVRMGKYYWDDGPADYDLRVNVARGIDLETDANYANDGISGADVVSRSVDGDTVSIVVGGTIMRGEGSNVDEDFFNIGNVDSAQTILARVRLPDYSTLVPVLEIRNSNNEVISLSPNPVDANVVRADISDTGTYYVDVVGFEGEGPDAGYVVDVSIQPTASLDFADLSVSQFTISDASLQSGQAVQVDWTVGNFGAVDTQGSQWTDRIVLSINDQFGDGDDIILANVAHDGALPVGETYAGTASVQIPVGVSGQYQLLVKTDVTDQIAEFLFEDNNVRSLAETLEIELTPYADLRVSDVVAAPDPGFVGEQATVTWVVANAGNAVTGDGTPGGNVTGWTDRVFVSADEVFGDGNDTLIAEVPRTESLASGSSYSGIWTGDIPSGLSGEYFWFVQADSVDDVYEHDNVEPNTASTSASILIAPSRYADLVPTVSSAPTNATSGQSVDVTWSTRNDGVRATSGSWVDRIYLSADGVLSSEDVLLASSSSSQSLEIDAIGNFSESVVLPERIEGEYFIIVHVNSNSNEFEFLFDNNNTIASDSLQIIRRPESDLIPTIVDVSPAVTSGSPFDITFSVSNTGEGDTVTNWQDLVVLSSDAEYDATDVPLGIFTSPSESLPLNAGGGAYTMTHPLTLPESISEGSYYLLVVADAGDEELESNEENNVISSSPVEVVEPRFPDLIVPSVSILAPSIIEAGSSFSLTWTVENRGVETATGPWEERVYLSNNPSGTNLQLLGSFRFEDSLAANAAGLVRQSDFILPLTGHAGDVHFVVEVDASQRVIESDEANGFVAATRTSVPLNLSISTNADQRIEGQAPARVIVSRNGDVASPLTVDLSPDVTAQFDFPEQVTIPAGQYSARFEAVALADGIVDGDQNVTISASAAGYPPTDLLLTAIDVDVTTLSLDFGFGSLDEGETGTATVAHNGPTTNDVVVVIGASPQVELTHPISIVIPSGQSSATFDVTAVDDDQLEGDDLVTRSLTAPGFRGAVESVQVNSSDAPAVTLTLPAEIVEGTQAGADFGSVTLDVVQPRDVTLLLTSSDPSSLFVLPNVTIPSGSNSATFALFSNDDTALNGTRAVEVSAVAVPSDGGPALEFILATATSSVLDNDGPTLTVAFDRNTVAEYGTATASVYRNTPTDDALSVNLSTDHPSELQIPASVIIPAGANSASFTVSGVADGVADGDQRTTLSATKDQFQAGIASIIVADIDQADLLATELSAPTAGTIGETVDVEWRVSNDGVAPARGQWTERLFWSADPTVGNDILTDSFQFEGPLGFGQFYNRSASIPIPSLPGQYYLVVQADADNAVREVLETNNYVVSSIPTIITAPYTATVSTDVESAPVGTSVLLTGSAMNTDGSAAVS
ncbi:MAG: CARDB domain-containing protein, partial [Planctomycetota bacterium]